MLNIKEIATRYKVPTNYVETEFEKIKSELNTDGLSPKDVELNSEELLHHRLRTATSKSKGELFFGMVLAVDRIKDNANPSGKPTRRSQQVDAFVANPDEAIATGKVALLESGEDSEHLIRTMKDRKTGEVKKETVTAKIWEDRRITVGDKTVVPLDNTAKWPNGKDNISYLRALPLHQYRTSVIVALKTSKGYKLAELDYTSEKTLPKIPMYVPVEFSANPKEEKDGILRLGTNRFTAFYPSITPFGATPIELLDGFLKGVKYPIAKLTEYHNRMVKEGKQWDTLVLVEAFVADIRGLEGTTPTLLINDNSTPQDEPLTRVMLHEGIDINFGIDSKVYVIARTSIGDKWDADSRTVLKGVPGDVTLWGMGIIPKFSTKPKNIKKVEEVPL